MYYIIYILVNTTTSSPPQLYGRSRARRLNLTARTRHINIGKYIRILINRVHDVRTR